MEDINLHFTGDFAAIEKANNLLSALIDNNLQNQKHSLQIDPRTITWKRVMDMNDRALRNIVIGLGGKGNGIVREDGFNITPASEIMAILCMSKDMNDLQDRLGRIYIGQTFEGKPVFAKDLKAVGAMAVLLKDAIKPNLVQTLEGNPAILHGGPFASIAQGTNTIIATKTGLSLADYVVTEAGFGADLGAEKFINIKCASAGLKPDAVVIVATIKALKHHGGLKADELKTPNPEAVARGFGNLQKHIENVLLYGITPFVAINSFYTDSEAENAVVQQLCAQMGVQAVLSKVFADGGKGGAQLAQAVIDSMDKNKAFQFLYNWNDSVENKILTIASKVYGAAGVEYTSKSRSQLRLIKNLGLDNLPVCMVKTPMSLSDDEKKYGRPEGFTVTVRAFEFASGAGFLIPPLGSVMSMPGLPAEPSAENISIDEQGRVWGLF